MKIGIGHVLAEGHDAKTCEACNPVATQRERYFGCLGLLADCSVYVPEEIREMIEVAFADAEVDGMRWRRTLNRIEIEPRAGR